MTLIRTILTIIIFYYIFRFIFNTVIPFLLKNYINNKGGFKDSFRNGEEQFGEGKEGEIKVKTNRKKKTETDAIGDYVDFEEIDK